ncbi:hypothetical protein ACFX5Q_23420 [Mesorhizobium sp. IMUNJ 23033]|uniref:hypothetical protein n=1 Tax=Mesorhizobium sp. IMUNJ 23033 TaxID=3378039 RepID=UPI00384F23F7
MTDTTASVLLLLILSWAAYYWMKSGTRDVMAAYKLGYVETRIGPVNRDRNPLHFWGLIGLYAFAAATLFLCFTAIIFTLLQGSGLADNQVLAPGIAILYLTLLASLGARLRR